MFNAEDHWYWDWFRIRFRLPSALEAVPGSFPLAALEAIPEALPPAPAAVPEALPPVLEGVPEALPPVPGAVPDRVPPPRSHGSARNASYGEVAAAAA